MIISKEYDKDINNIITEIRNNLYDRLLTLDINFTNISFLVPITNDFIEKYKINDKFEFIASFSDWNDVELIINYNGRKIEPISFFVKPDNYVEPHLLDIFQECIKQNTHTPDIKKLQIPDIKRDRKHKLNRIK